MDPFETFDYAVPIVIWAGQCTDEECDSVEDRVCVLALQWLDRGLLLAALAAESMRMRAENPDSFAWSCMAEVSDQFAIHLLQCADGIRR